MKKKIIRLFFVLLIPSIVHSKMMNMVDKNAYNVNFNSMSQFITLSVEEIFNALDSEYFNVNDLNKSLLQRVDVVIGKAQNKLINSRENNYWNKPSYLGNHFASQFYLWQRWQGEAVDASRAQALKIELLSSQNPDGSWTSVADINIPLSLRGEISTTYLNYLALKAMGENINLVHMAKARNYILQNGGVEKVNLFGKIFLSLFNNYEWKKIEKIPLFIFNPKVGQFASIASVNQFAQWVRPHLMPIAYLKDREVAKDLGVNFELRELDHNFNIHNKNLATTRDTKQEDLIFNIISRQEKHGSWGGYASATMFTTMALQHYAKTVNHPLISEQIHYQNITTKAYSFLTTLNNTPYDTQLKGIVDDGKLWDTVLSVWALGSSNFPMGKINSVNEFYNEFIMKNGGFIFGIDFDPNPDTDDTAIGILAMIASGKTVNINKIKKAEQFIVSMQNSDGGWGAFSKDNNSNMVVEFFARDFLDSADLYDEASPDVTGHILEALGKLGHTSTNSKVVDKAIKYLEKEVSIYPAYFGRWGINYIYGTSAVISGLHEVGVSNTSYLITKPITWLKERQNKDGGFGESTLSYKLKEWRGRGVSTPTQTAWAIIALVKAGLAKDTSTTKAVKYLLKQYEINGEWHSTSVTGTGHPRVVYMQYPIYDMIFPLLALGEYRNAIKQNCIASKIYCTVL